MQKTLVLRPALPILVVMILEGGKLQNHRFQCVVKHAAPRIYHKYLTLFIKGHDHNSGSMALDSGGMLPEGLLALLHGDGVDGALALATLEACLHNEELGGVDHEGHLADLGVRHQQVHKLGHGRHAIDQAIIHVNVQHMSALLDLSMCISVDFQSVHDVTGNRSVCWHNPNQACSICKENDMPCQKTEN